MDRRTSLARPLSSPLARVGARLRRRRGQRGDVPGWVLITVMTIGVGVGLFKLAEPQLTAMLQSALSSVQ
ncbi:hypothetical protein E8D34_10520 [Nocardioides sp. GY 10113]|uniref:hypothetical protein n=1 Tax=Nocardioides sp. GY 10113 TaxID=2569761 RepID=UPI0010A8158A|nr:hypothetical protein [Nocardioides sp. GY 10113]TIC87538.1 hypothetical protein E8D34_10520 [Nocardioides sp. GY 10113]